MLYWGAQERLAAWWGFAEEPAGRGGVFVSTAAMSAAVSRAVAAGKLRRLGSRLYTTNRSEDRSRTIRRRLWEVAAGFFPRGLVADRTAPRTRTGPGRLGVSHAHSAAGGKVELPGVTLRARAGSPDRCPTIFLREDLYCMSTARALIENMRPTRARSGAARTLKRSEIETWLEHFLRNSGPERLNALRDQIQDARSPAQDGGRRPL